ncbi:mandelate racemase/muconate lactonizing enzyme family protein [Tundrisphaera lichenicola]|uniref:mandelate racemase/muconate lactonizing enzyme family protein n=1 Tax=Tundrisphaera lichenicola TaxID=2029860 RepID=UPI003EC02E94
MRNQRSSSPFPRRDLFRGAALGMASAGLTVGPIGSRAASADEAKPVDLTIEELEVIPVRVPFREVPKRNMARELPHWDSFEVVRVRLRSGHVGHGESMAFYTWGRTTEEDLKRAGGKNAATLMWDDSLGAGLQIALFDAVGRALGVPIHSLLGMKVRDRAALSWWAIDMPPEDWASECQEAVRLGYGAFKTKGRPWYDIREQVRAVAAVVPADFKIDMDFNDTLLDAERAIPILKELEETPQVGIFETPIPQKDVPGNKAICEAVRTPIAMHYGTPPALVAIKEGACDGFVVGGGARALIEQGNVAAMADMPFWLQLVGTGITAAFSLQVAAVLSHAKWPAVNCHQLYTHTLLTSTIALEGGTTPIPDAPGLGFEIDQEALRKFRVAPMKDRPEPARLVEVGFPDGGKLYVASDDEVNFMLRQGNLGTIPYYRPGARARLVPNDGGDRWKKLYEKAREKPFMIVP